MSTSVSKSTSIIYLYLYIYPSIYHSIYLIPGWLGGRVAGGGVAGGGCPGGRLAAGRGAGWPGGWVAGGRPASRWREKKLLWGDPSAPAKIVRLKWEPLPHLRGKDGQAQTNRL